MSDSKDKEEIYIDDKGRMIPNFNIEAFEKDTKRTFLKMLLSLYNNSDNSIQLRILEILKEIIFDQRI